MTLGLPSSIKTYMQFIPLMQYVITLSY